MPGKTGVPLKMAGRALPSPTKPPCTYIQSKPLSLPWPSLTSLHPSHGRRPATAPSADHLHGPITMKNLKVLEIKPPPQSAPAATSSSSSESDSDELGRMELAPPLAHRKVLSKQLSMKETRRDAAWERRRRQMMGMKRSKTALGHGGLEGRSLTDEDLDELKGSIELGFGFNEEDVQKLSGTLPALDFFFAINRSAVSTPSAESSSSSIGSCLSVSSMGSPRSPNHSDSAWKICSPGMYIYICLFSITFMHACIDVALFFIWVVP